MPIWNPNCRHDEPDVHQTYIGNLAVLWDQLEPALTARADDYSAVLGGVVGQLIRRLESQANVHGRRVKATAAALDALGPPDGIPPVSDVPDEPPQLAQDVTSAPDSITTGLQAQLVLGDGGVTGRQPTPVEPDHPLGFLFGEGHERWHPKAVEWYGKPLADMVGSKSLAEYVALRTSESGAGDAPDPTIPDIYGS